MSERIVLPGSVWIDENGARKTITDAPQFGVERWTRHRGTIKANGVVYQTTGSKPETEILAEWKPELQLTLLEDE
jgi:hypothetical protein